MKRFCLLVVAVVALWGLSSEVSAQGFFGVTQGRVQAVSLARGGPVESACRASTWAGWSILRGARGSFSVEQWTGTAPWPLKGLWLGATEEVVGCDGFGFLVSGSVFVPQRASGTWLRSPVPDAVPFDIPSYDWWSIDGLITSRISGSFELLAGFRWDHTSTRVNYSDHSDDDYILNAYLPLIGLQMNQRSCNGSLLVRFMGAPVGFWEPQISLLDRDRLFGGWRFWPHEELSSGILRGLSSLDHGQPHGGRIREMEFAGSEDPGTTPFRLHNGASLLESWH